MSQTDFEPIYEGLKALMARAPSLKLVSRRLRHFTQVSSSEHPALFITQKGEQTVNTKGQPTKWHLKMDVYLYVHVGDDMEAVPSTALNAVLAEIRALLVPHPVAGVPDGLQGLVSHAWIGEEIELFDGVAGAQAIAVIPLEVLTV
jgi:hypothetical protein